MKRFVVFQIIALIICTNINALELAPWFSPFGQPELRVDYTTQYYRWVREGKNAVEFPSADHFVNLSGSLAVDPYAVEVELNFAGTTAHTFGQNDGRVTGRYQILNDVSGEDPVSMVGGVTLSYARKRFIDDISVFHHGRFEYMFHLAVGKEDPFGPYWGDRAWGVVLLGATPDSSMWLFTKGAIEKNWCDVWQAEAFIIGLVGFGDDELDVSIPFEGYGPIRHRSVGIGGSLRYNLSEWGWLEARYSYRVWSINFPAYNQFVSLRLTYPFSL